MDDPYPDAFRLPQLPKPIIFALKSKTQVVLRARSRPLPAARWKISGITKDSTGAVLGNCSVYIYRTDTNAFVGSTTSNASGEYFIESPLSGAHYAVAYKAGSPDVGGVTVNTIAGT